MSDKNCCGACGYPIHATKESACDWCRQTADRIEALTAKLAKAVEGLHTISGHAVLNNENEEELSESALLARATLAEIEGEKT